MTELFPRCDACGIPGDLRPVTVTYTKNEKTEMICDLCQGLVDAGMLRREGDRYRQWHFEWKPGKLMPKVEL